MNKDSKINDISNNIKKKPLNGKKTKIAIVLAFLFLIYSIFLLIKLLSNPIDTFIVEKGKIYKEESVTGYILRDEQLVEGENFNGNIVQLIDEGKKVAKGEAIYRYSLENEDELNQKIAELDTQIQNALHSENTLFSTDIKLLENQIEDKLINIYQNTNIKEISRYKNEISNYINKKAKITGDLTPNGSYVKQLIQQRSEYENQLNNNSKYIYANKSGIISYRIDELESKLTVGNFEYLNKDFLESLNLKNSQIIAINNSQAKIIDNFKCYIACVLKSEEALKSQVRDNIKIRLPNSEEIPATIVYKNNESDNEVLLVFEIQQSVENLIDYRKIIFDVIWWSDSGMKIPNSAIQYDGKFAYVIRNRAGYEEKILVKILRQNENYSIVKDYSTQELEEEGYDISNLESKKSISIYDEIIIKK